LEGFDYIVVGAGTAGCVVAGRLCENLAARVCLIEAGGGDNTPVLRVPGLGFLANGRDKYLQRDMTEPEAALNGRRLVWAHGRVVGGGSSINGMLYTRGHSSEYDVWNCAGWSFRELLPLFRQAENSERGADAWHGDRGPLRIRRGRSPLPISDAFLEAATDAGVPVVDDLNADPPEGIGHFDHSIGGGYRSSTSTAYLRTLRRRGSLTLLKQTQVLGVTVRNGRAVGVRIVRGMGVTELAASQEVILCAGTIGSPHLLMLSGIGEPAELAKHGVVVVAASRDVGKNLQNHVRMALRYTCEADATAYRYLAPLTAARGVAQYAATRSGFLAETVISTGGSLKSDPGLAVADLKVTLFNALMGSAGGRLGLLPDRHGFALSINQGIPLSRGEIRLRSADPHDRPQIHANNFAEPSDMAVLARGVLRLREMMNGKAMARLGVREIAHGATQGDLHAEIRATAANVFHDVGTCRMGMDAGSVVDEQLRVRGVDGLRVADASIAPRLLNANTNAAAVVIGEKAARLLQAAS
jgi:choline dehydrogenase